MSEDWCRIGSGPLTAAINPLGAELSSLRDRDGRELMTDADPAFWTGRAPILFPIVGALDHDRYRLAGREYALAKHGFARRQRFEVVEHSADGAVFRLTDNHQTRLGYPFAFVLEVAFAIAESTLAIEATVTNRGDAPMPASFGFHPAFAWPLPYGRDRAAHRIEFADAEPEPLAALSDDGLIAAASRPTPLDGRTLMLRDALFTHDALIWPRVTSRSVTYRADRGPALRVDFPHMPALGIWTRPGAGYVCIEPWHGIADPAGFTGEIWDKPGILRIEAGEARSFGMQVTLDEGPQAD